MHRPAEALSTLDVSVAQVSGNPASVLLTAARELRAHGHRDAPVEVANRAVEWTQNPPSGSVNRGQLGTALGLAASTPASKDSSART